MYRFPAFREAGFFRTMVSMTVCPAVVYLASDVSSPSLTVTLTWRRRFSPSAFVSRFPMKLPPPSTTMTGTGRRSRAREL